MDKPLPIGLQSFEKLIRQDYLYIDKTAYIYQLVQPPTGVYFLHRPRRFGKSLLTSTLKALFEGKRDLFAGLAISNTPYDFPEHPVIHLDFSQLLVTSSEAFTHSLTDYLLDIAQAHGISLPLTHSTNTPALLRRLIRALARQGSVVLLIDEYDAPIINNLSPEKLDTAKAIREELKAFFATIKASDAYLRFIFLTGISKFSKVGVFSGLNNLLDISMQTRYANLLGISQTELERDFAAPIKALAQAHQVDASDILEKIRYWYNGFCFTPNAETLYNPFSLLLLFDSRHFRHYWFQTATPSFLMEHLKQQQVDVRRLEHLRLSETQFDSYDLEHLSLPTLLVQTGYLTITGVDAKDRYTLSYPNYEVRKAFLEHVYTHFSHHYQLKEPDLADKLEDALHHLKWQRFINLFNSLLASIPYQLHDKDTEEQTPPKHENYYHSLFHATMSLLGQPIASEVSTHRGRIDSVIHTPTHIIIFEFKRDDDLDSAVKQVSDKDYPKAYEHFDKPIFLVFIHFNSTLRQIDAYKVLAPYTYS